MSQHELLKRAVEAFHAERIPFMLTGSFASGLQGSPRATHDIDFVVEMSVSDLRRFLDCFAPPDYYADHDAALAAVQSGARNAMFNIIDVRGGDKIDLWMVSDDPFDLSRFSRRRTIEFEGVPIDVSTPEDTILMKLRWAEASGGSRKHLLDALRVYEVNGRTLDAAYLDLWAARLDVLERLEQLRRDARAL